MAATVCSRLACSQTYMTSQHYSLHGLRVFRAGLSAAVAIFEHWSHVVEL